MTGLGSRLDPLLDLIAVAAGTIYLVASFLLFVLGVNMAALAAVSWRKGSATRPEARASTGQGDTPDVPPSVTVQLPIYNELYVAERVIRAAAGLEYPADRLQIQVLDDSTDETIELIRQVVAELRAEGVDVVHLHRADRTGYKAGALAAGLASATGELVAIFDADFVPGPDFLVRTVGHFTDPDLAFVQCRWGHLNRSFSWITRLQSLAIDAHFAVEQGARGHRGFWFNFNGTAGIWRRRAIEDAGGWTADTLTEDLDLSYRVHLRGWHGHYRDDLEVPAELPVRIAGFRRQQHRWARGSLECARKLLPAIWRSDAGWLTKFEATTHLTAYGIHLLLVVLAVLYPGVVLAGARIDGFATLWGFGYVIALTSLAPALFFITGQHLRGRPLGGQIPSIAAVSVLGSAMMVNTLRASVQIFTRPDPEFERTAKFGIDDAGTGGNLKHHRYHLHLDRVVLAEIGLGLYCTASAFFAFGQRNWGIFTYSSIFGAGLLSLAVLSICQAIRDGRGPSPSISDLQSSRLEPDVGSEAVLIMSKRPLPGRSKTRLAPVLSPSESADLARCLLLDAVDICLSAAARRPGLRVVVAGSPAGDGGYFTDLVPEVDHVDQIGDDLGACLDHVLTSALDLGHARVVAVNSDSPTLPSELVEAAFERLTDPEVDVVLGPADDGGYYLIGWKRPHPRLVTEVGMSTPSVLEDTLAIAAEEGLSVALLDRWYDVDEPVDLRRLQVDVDAGMACGLHTRAFLADLRSDRALGLVSGVDPG